MSSIFIAKTNNELEKCFPVMKELRPHLNIENYFSIYENAHRTDGYEIVIIEDHGEVQALMGYRILYDYVRGKHVYIDDLVSTEKSRSKGFGAELLKYAENIARQQNCTTLRLCTGLDNSGGIKFYEKHGWSKRSFAYTKKIS